MNEHGWSMRVELGDCPLLAPWRYWLSSSEPGVAGPFLASLTREFPWWLLESLDSELRRPCERSLRHAINTAIALGASLPRSVLLFDSDEKEFIDAHSRIRGCASRRCSRDSIAPRTQIRSYAPAANA